MRNDTVRPNRLGYSPGDFGIGRLFYSIPDAIIVSDASGRIVLWNAGATEMLGHAEADALGQNVLMLVPPEFRDRHEAGMREFRRRGRGPLIDGGQLVDLPALHKEGRTIWMQLRLLAIPEAQAESGPFALAIMRDITAQHEAEQRLRRTTVAKPLARRLLTEFVQRGGMDRQMLVEIGRSLADSIEAASIEAYIDAFEEMGFGHLQRTNVHEAKFEFAARDLLERVHETRATTCYLTLGYLTGAVERASGLTALGTEVHCQSRGDDTCQFVVHARD